MEKRDRRLEKKIDRYKVVDGQELCYCSSEGVFRPCSEFIKSTGYYHGYDYRCKSCVKQGKNSLHGVSVEIEKEYRKVLDDFYRKCGYDPESPLPIHAQFLLRHDL